MLLDWEKAFDKVKHDKLFEALERMSIPDKTLKAIKQLYKNPTFRIEMEGRTSEWTKQNSGIRQGCPLSPYLFVLLMSIMFNDIKEVTKNQLEKGVLEHFDSTEIMYADDTLLIGQNIEVLSIYVQEIEKESNKYNMSLNKEKCNAIYMSIVGDIHFSDGSIMKEVKTAQYLGAKITQKAYAYSEINHRIGIAIRTARILNNFWKGTNIPIK